MSTPTPTPPPPRADTNGYGKRVDLSGSAINVGLPSNGPALLLPIHIETRFMGTGRNRELWVRIFPDQISTDSHDMALTKDEWAASVRYWRAMWTLKPGDMDKQRVAWSELASAFGPRRAAYVAQVTAPPGFDAWIAGLPAGQPPTTLGHDKPFQPTPPQNLRETSWEKAPMARALPTQWLVALYANGVPVFCTLVDRTKQDLAVGPTPPPKNDPNADPQAAMQWMFEFEKAIKVGMAVKIALPLGDPPNGFDQVVVVGVSEADAKAGSDLIQHLITAHRFTDGFAFVPQGTPTKNSTDSKAGYSRHDDNYADSFRAERQAPLIKTMVQSPITTPPSPGNDARDAHFFADLLGIGRSVLMHIPNADGVDQQDAINMIRVLWPATGGYSIPYIYGYEGVPIEDLRQFVIANVRPRGPVPAFRIGKVPYGVLPVMSIQQPVETAVWPPLLLPISKLVNAAIPHWLSSLKDPAPDASGAHDAMNAVLGTDATSCRINAALCFGPYLQWNLWRFDYDELDSALGNLAAAYEHAYNSSTAAVAAQLDALGWTKRVGRLSGLVLQALYAYNLRLVTADNAISETDPLPEIVGLNINYVQYFKTKTVSDLLKDGYGQAPATLLFRLLWRSVLLEYASVAATVLKVRLQEPEYFPKTEARHPLPTFTWALNNPKFSIDPGAPPANGLALGDYIHSRLATPEGQKAYPTLASMFETLQALAPRPTAALQRTFIETLDLWAYRLDAWWTSLGTAALSKFRATAGSGVSVGVYGYVENLKPAAPQPSIGDVEPDEIKKLKNAGLAGTGLPDPVAPKPDNNGFVYAPSLSQAVTAAVLRNGYISLGGEGGTASHAVDLSSARVRSALQLMEGINQGQHLGALLGYQFEMHLLQSQPNVAQYIPVFRNLYPIVANKLTSEGPAESVAASNVVDGAALQQAWIAGKIPWGDYALPRVRSGAEYDAISRALNLLNDTVDAVSDISTAETIFQVVRGNPVRAGGALDAVSRDQHAPEPQVIETPRGGLDFTQRLLSFFSVDPDKPPRSSWLGSATSARASAEPYLEQWLTAILPDPSKVQFQLSYTPNGNHPAPVTVTLDQVGISALDLIALTPTAPDPAKPLQSGAEITGSELERWMVAQCAMVTRRLPIGATHISLAYGRDVLSHAPVVLPELLLLTRAVKELLGAARPVTAADLVPPASQSDLPPADMAQLSSRIQRAAAAFGDLVNSLDQLVDKITAKLSSTPPASVTADEVDALSSLLLTASSFDDPGAAPVSIGRDADSITSLAKQASLVRLRIDKRWKDMNSHLFDAQGNNILTAGATLPMIKRAVQDLFGKTFVVLPTYTPATGDSLQIALSDTTKARTAWGSLPQSDRLHAARVLQQMTHVHPSAARADQVLSLAAVMQSRASGQTITVTDLEVAQLPYDPAIPWLAIQKPPGQFPWDASLHGKCALLLWMPRALRNAPGPSICGLIFDEWVERIPNDTERTAVAFHYEEPASRAPQTLLLAIAPPGKPWSAQLLFDTVRETMQFAKVRCVDPESLQGVGQLIPALYFGYNSQGLTVSTEFVGLSAPESS